MQREKIQASKTPTPKRNTKAIQNSNIFRRNPPPPT